MTTEGIRLSKRLDEPQSRHLVFTSAGDYSNLRLWLDSDRTFDLWISYFGDKPKRYEKDADYYMARKGGKFPALRAAYDHWPEIFDRYDAVFIPDDDLVLSASQIDRLFRIREEYDLWILQPAFDARGRISHPITRAKPWNLLRFTNFVEVTCPLFRKDRLDLFMKEYDSVLVGWGIDWWYLDVLGPDLEGRVAVVDAVSCINPPAEQKGGFREIDALQRRDERIAAWNTVRRERGIASSRRGFLEYGAVLDALCAKNLFRGIQVGYRNALSDAIRRARSVIRRARSVKRALIRPRR